MRIDFTSAGNPAAHLEVHFGTLFFEFDCFPIRLNLFFSGGFYITINMGVTVNELITNTIQYIGNIEAPFSLPIFE